VVVFQVAGGCGLGALDAAKGAKVWGVGVDADQGYLGSYILTSALKRVDTAVFNSIKNAKDGTFNGGADAVYGLKDQGVGIGKFSPATPKGIPAKVDAIKAKIVGGKITNIPTTVK
jgi:basic membrane protein A